MLFMFLPPCHVLTAPGVLAVPSSSHPWPLYWRCPSKFSASCVPAAPLGAECSWCACPAVALPPTGAVLPSQPGERADHARRQQHLARAAAHAEPGGAHHSVRCAGGACCCTAAGPAQLEDHHCRQVRPAAAGLGRGACSVVLDGWWTGTMRGCVSLCIHTLPPSFVHMTGGTA
jgi:hypothetical protein